MTDREIFDDPFGLSRRLIQSYARNRRSRVAHSLVRTPSTHTTLNSVRTQQTPDQEVPMAAIRRVMERFTGVPVGIIENIRVYSASIPWDYAGHRDIPRKEEERTKQNTTANVDLKTGFTEDQEDT